MLSAFIQEIRPKQWIKNLIIAGPLFFSLNVFDTTKLGLTLATIALFCAVASAVYLINDLADIERDRLHPVKRHRPLASGALPPRVGVAAAILLGAGAPAAAFVINWRVSAVLAAYLVINVAYSLRLKHFVILDVMTLASGFVLRVLAGGLAIGVPVSEWLFMCTLLLSLFLGFAKRRHEITLLSDGAQTHRAVLVHYSPYLLDQLIMIVTASTVVSYALYTVSPHTVAFFGTSDLIYTVPFVMYGIFRYLYLVHKKEGGGNPSRVFLTDAPILVAVVLWLATCGLIIYRDRLTAMFGM